MKNLKGVVIILLVIKHILKNFSIKNISINLKISF